jgi:hypothetical protein
MSFGLADLKNVFDRPKVQSSSSPSNSATSSQAILGTIEEDFLAVGSYKIEPQNWFTAKPYGFQAFRRDGTSTVMFLPINPSNLTITTSFATNMITTLYGTVEEHSDVRYYDISIDGTTGMAPRFIAPSDNKGHLNAGQVFKTLRRSGRSSVAVSQGISAGGFFSKTVGAINNTINKATDLLKGDPEPKVGVVSDNSGYVAFHNLYRFLLKYKKDASGVENTNTSPSGKHPLTFFNYKDNNQYDVVVRNFVMKRSADNPMLYHYSIQLRGYNLRGVSDKIDERLYDRLKDLGLAGIDGSSALGDIKKKANQAKSVLGSALGGINTLGR